MKPYGYTKKAHTCRWCGRALKREKLTTVADDEAKLAQIRKSKPKDFEYRGVPLNDKERKDLIIEQEGALDNLRFNHTLRDKFRGRDQNGLFCTLTCGYLWAIAQHRRLTPPVDHFGRRVLPSNYVTSVADTYRLAWEKEMRKRN